MNREYNCKVSSKKIKAVAFKIAKYDRGLLFATPCILSVPCRLSTDPKIHDSEWLFYVQFSIFTNTNHISAIMLHTYRAAA